MNEPKSYSNESDSKDKMKRGSKEMKVTTNTNKVHFTFQ